MRYQSKRPKRQFVAGVKCPSCGAMDKVVQIELFEPVYDEYIECTDCGYTERRPTPEDLPTIQQQNAQTEGGSDDGVGIVKFL